MIYFMGFKQLANLLANFSNFSSKSYYSAPTSNSISASLLLPKSTFAL